MDASVQDIVEFGGVLMVHVDACALLIHPTFTII